MRRPKCRGTLSLALGVLLAIQPQAGAIALVWLIGAYAILAGVLLIVLALCLRGWSQQSQGILG